MLLLLYFDQTKLKTNNNKTSFSLTQATAGGVRRFTKPPESLERSLELSRHRGRKRTQKRPNYKNLGEDEDDERAGGSGGSGIGGGLQESWDDDGRGAEREGGREREKGKGTEGGGGGSSKASRASGETAEGEFVSHWTQQYRTVTVFLSVSLFPSIQHSHVTLVTQPPHSSSLRLQTEKRKPFHVLSVAPFVFCPFNAVWASPCISSFKMNHAGKSGTCMIPAQCWLKIKIVEV